jgi:uncharacterized membrane protein YfhO
LQHSSAKSNSTEVKDFTANSLNIAVSTEGDQNKQWLYIADAWHPFWRAYVNNAEVPVLRANFGFKAVEIPSGRADVKFVYSSSLLSITILLAWVILAVIMVLILWQAWRLMFSPSVSLAGQKRS